MCNYGALIAINLGSNNLTGTLIENFYYFHYIVHVDLSKNNLRGSIDGRALMRLKNVKHIDLSRNNFTGRAELLTSRATQHLNISHNQISAIRFKKFNPEFDYLGVVEMSNNLIDQDISEVLQNVPHNLYKLRISNNSIRGELSNSFPHLIHLDEMAIDNNNLTGTLPARLHLSIPRLVTHTLSRQQAGLTGSIPDEYLNFRFILNLDLSDNKLTGSIPYIGQLETLILHDNILTGPIPYGYGGLDCKPINILFVSPFVFLTYFLPEQHPW